MFPSPPILVPQPRLRAPHGSSPTRHTGLGGAESAAAHWSIWHNAPSTRLPRIALCPPNGGIRVVVLEALVEQSQGSNHAGAVPGRQIGDKRSQKRFGRAL